MKLIWHSLIFFFMGLFLCLRSQVAQAQTPYSGAVVHAILFYSPDCGHCHLVITEALPALFEQYGEQLYLAGVDVSQAGGQALFYAALQYFNLESGGVPLLVVGDTYLIGSVDIPEKFPGLIEQYLAQGGVGWPEIPGLAEAMAASETAQGSTPTASSPAEPTSEAATPTPAALPATPTPSGFILSSENDAGPWERLGRDPQGNGLALVVLAGMLFSVIGASMSFKHSSLPRQVKPIGWAIPILCILGLCVAGYLAYVETTRVEAVCGPVGDCNTVQQSEYAHLFGILPIGVLGVVGYILIMLAWVITRFSGRIQAAYASLALFGMTAFGVLFSIYLTFLEPFVIGATCAWCLTSAIFMTALFWLSLAPARSALSILSMEKKYAYRRSNSQRAL